MLTAVRDILIPLNWHVLDGLMIPKVQIPRQLNVADYREIVIRNVEGMFFWSLIISQRCYIYQHLVTKNSFIGTMFQKGSIQKMGGC